MPPFIVETEELSYSFGKQKALDRISLNMPQGSIYGFLGPNGAGKTTALRLLLGLLKPDKTSIRIFGLELFLNRIQILARVGSLIEQPSLYLHLTGRENLEVFRLSNKCRQNRIAEVLKIVGLSEFANRKARAYSFGMKQRLAIAIALLHDPELLVLDEPTNGLDPLGIIEIRELVKKLNREYGKSILISSHLLNEIDKMVTHVGILHYGKLLFQGTFEELQRAKERYSSIEVEVNDVEKARLLLNGQYSIKKITNNSLHIQYADREQLAGINEILVLNQLKVYRLSLTQDQLEDLFVQITSI